MCILFYVYECFGHMYVLHVCCACGGQKSSEGPLSWGHGWLEYSLCECWQLNTSPLQEQVLLITEPSLHPCFFFLLNSVLKNPSHVFYSKFLSLSLCDVFLMVILGLFVVVWALGIIYTSVITACFCLDFVPILFQILSDFSVGSFLAKYSFQWFVVVVVVLSWIY